MRRESRAFNFALLRLAITIPASRPIIAMTTNNSIRVKPRERPRARLRVFIWTNCNGNWGSECGFSVRVCITGLAGALGNSQQRRVAIFFKHPLFHHKSTSILLSRVRLSKIGRC